MSKEVDALIIIGHSHMIAQEAPEINHEDIGHGLWVIRNTKAKKWADGAPITDEDINSLFAGEVFLQLGGLASSRYMQQLSEQQQHNPFRETVLDVLDEISPFESGEALPEELAIKWASMRLTERELPEMFDAALTADPTIEDELKDKWSKAQAVHALRGKVAVMAYDTSALLHGLGKLKMDEIAPDEVEFDKDLNVISQSHDLGRLVDRSGVKPSLMEVPYYQTFSNSKKNQIEMLTAAIEDLRLVRQAIA